MKTPTKINAEQRRAQILAAALRLSETHGYTKVTLQQIADAAGVSKGLPMTYFSTMTGIRRAIMCEAVRTSNLRVIAQGLVVGDDHAKKAPQRIRQQALAAAVG